MNLFLQLLGNGLVQGAVAMLYAAGFGFVYRSFRVFHIATGAQFEPKMTARGWFIADQVEDLGGGKKNAFNEWPEKDHLQRK